MDSLPKSSPSYRKILSHVPKLSDVPAGSQKMRPKVIDLDPSCKNVHRFEQKSKETEIKPQFRKAKKGLF
jgi:hypothetical protein